MQQQHLSSLLPESDNVRRWRMSFGDERDLRWYYCEGQMLFERSPIGAVLERAHAFSTIELREPLEAVTSAQGRVIGHRSAITAHITAETRAPASYMPRDQDLFDYAKINRRVSGLARSASAVFEAFYGDLGERWVGCELQGQKGADRLCALFHLVKAGKAWLELEAQRALAKGHAALDVSVTERMGVLVDIAHKRPSLPRLEALARCKAQATRSYNEACMAWKAVIAAERPRKVVFGQQSARPAERPRLKLVAGCAL